MPGIAGIREGSFSGQVVIENRHAGGRTIAAPPPVTVGYDLVSAQVFQVTPPVASLGQYVLIEGGGFVGGEAGASTGSAWSAPSCPPARPRAARSISCSSPSSRPATASAT
ncbi:MAG: hypothetical protein HS111_21665 [Kofleriaceae bacterium]|nr:hypothetical protein [Kofleriaceae bacterium]